MIRPERTAANSHAPQVGLGGTRPILAMTDVGACWMLLDCWNFADPWYYIQPQCYSKASKTCLTAGLWESRLMLWQRLELECEELSDRTRSLWNLLLSSSISFFFVINIFILHHSSWNSNFTAKVISQQPKMDSMIIFLYFSLMIILGMCQFSFHAWIKKTLVFFFNEYQYLIYCTFAYFWVLLFLTESVWLVLLSHQCSQGKNR